MTDGEPLKSTPDSVDETREMRRVGRRPGPPEPPEDTAETQVERSRQGLTEECKPETAQFDVLADDVKSELDKYQEERPTAKYDSSQFQGLLQFDCNPVTSSVLRVYQSTVGEDVDR